MSPAFAQLVRLVGPAALVLGPWLLGTACEDSGRPIDYDSLTNTWTNPQGGSGGGGGAGGGGLVTATTEWSIQAGSQGNQYGRAIAADADGNVVVAGYFDGSIDFGDGALSTAGSYDLFVTKLGPDGAAHWSHSFGAQAGERALAVAVDANGNAVLVGQFDGELDFGPGPLVSGGDDLFVAKLGVDGETLWAQHPGAIGLQGSRFDALDVAVDSAGNISLGGLFRADGAGLDFGGTPLAGYGATDGFVAQLDPDGGHRWSFDFGDAQEQAVTDVAADDEAVVVVGEYSGTMELGGETMVAEGSSNGFVARFDPSGEPQWTVAFDGSTVVGPDAVALDPASGDVVVAFTFGGTMAVGGEEHTATASDVLLARLGASGEVRWSRSFGADGFDEVADLTVDADGNAVLVGTTDGAIDFGGGSLGLSDGWALFLAKIDASGAYLYADLWSAAQVSATGVAAADLDAIVTGSFAGTLDLGAGELASPGAEDWDVFVARLGF